MSWPFAAQRSWYLSRRSDTPQRYRGRGGCANPHRPIHIPLQESHVQASAMVRADDDHSGAGRRALPGRPGARPRRGAGRDERPRRARRHPHRRTPRPASCSAVLARAVGARRVVEVGTAIGVSTLHLARAVGDGGLVTSFEIDPARHSAARGVPDPGGDDRPHRTCACRTPRRACASSREASIWRFWTASRTDYPAHLELALAHVRSGGLVAVDNVLPVGHGRDRPRRRPLDRRARRAHARVQPPVDDRSGTRGDGAAGGRWGGGGRPPLSMLAAFRSGEDRRPSITYCVRVYL